MLKSPLLSTRKGWIAIIAIICIPLLYSGFYLGAFWNPYGHLDRLKIAVVNESPSSQTTKLIHSLRSTNQVSLMTAHRAAKELSTNAVAEVITIPKTYTMGLKSRHIVPLQFTLDAGNNYLQSVLMQRQVQAIELSLQTKYQSYIAQAIAHVQHGSATLTKSSDQLSRSLDTLTTNSQSLAAHTKALQTQVPTAVASPLATIQTNQSKISAGLHGTYRGSQKISKGLSVLTNSLSKMPGHPPALSQFGTLTIRHSVSYYGEGLAPYFLALSLWVGTLVATVIIPGGQRKTLTLRQRTSFGIQMSQVIVLAGGLLLILPIRPIAPLTFWASLFLIGLTWWSVIRLLAEKLGDAGRIIAIALLVIQLAGSGGTYPMALSPGFFRAVHAYLPMSWAVSLIRYSLTHSLGPAAETDTIKLAGLMVVCWLLTRFTRAHLRFETPLLEPEE